MKKNGTKPKKKKAYRKPRLTAHGEVRKLTQAKAGVNNDGGGKPATKTSGPQA